MSFIDYGGGNRLWKRTLKEKMDRRFRVASSVGPRQFRRDIEVRVFELRIRTFNMAADTRIRSKYGVIARKYPPRW